MSFYNSDGDYADTAPTCEFVIQHRPTYVECGVMLADGNGGTDELCAIHADYVRGER